MKREIDTIDDDTKKWSRAQAGLYIPLDNAQIAEAQAILRQFANLVDVVTGSSSADPFVIALAKMQKHVLVTEERWTNSPKKTKIPNVCAHYGVPYIPVLELIRREKWTFR